MLLHTGFEHQAARCPDTIAATQGLENISYGELDARANQLAHHLVARGTGADCCVALLTDRSLDFIVTVLGVLKAGAAFVPLDPAWPQERKALAMGDCGARWLVTSGRPPPALAAEGIESVDLTEHAHLLRRHPTTPPRIRNHPATLAYVIYTSGSTGAPKGVMVEHRAISAHIASISRLYGIGPSDVCLLFHSVAFDPTVEQAFSALSSGARLLVRGAELWSGREFAEVVARHGVTVADLPTRYWQQLLHDWQGMSPPPSLGALRLVLVGGEALPLPAVRLWRQLGLSGVRLMNCYGPTECCVTATCEEVGAHPGPHESTGRIPIGRPHGPVEACILGPDMEPLPAGLAGELWLGGPTLARGYFGKADLTRERFLPHPFGQDGRLYRTGDLARQLPDGAIDFLGRADNQVKIRGFRVELDEVETHLTAHPDVTTAAVVVTRDGDGEALLLACVQPAASPGPEPAELHAHMSRHLPAYMLPDRFAIVDRLPVDANGKVDRAALARLPSVPPGASQVLHPPRSPAEEKIASIWCQLLKRDKVGVHDDFFQLGGHSLLAMRLIAGVNAAFGANLSMSALFAGPTVHRLALSVGKPSVASPAAGLAPATRLLLPIQPKGNRPPLFFCAGGHGSEEEFVVVARISRLIGEHQPVIGIRVGGHDRLEPLHRDALEMAAEAFDEMVSQQPRGPYFLAGECVGGLLAAAIAHRAESLGAEVRFLGLLDAAVPRRLEPLLAWMQSHWAVRLLGRALVHLREIRKLPIRDRAAYLRGRGRWVRTHVAIGLTSPGTMGLMPENPDLYHYVQTLIRHRPENVRARISLFLSEASARQGMDRAWRNRSDEGLTVITLAGTHESYIREHAGENALKLRQHLDAAYASMQPRRPWKIPLRGNGPRQSKFDRRVARRA